jgi:hypothetical protein
MPAATLTIASAPTIMIAAWGTIIIAPAARHRPAA